MQQYFVSKIIHFMNNTVSLSPFRTKQIMYLMSFNIYFIRNVIVLPSIGWSDIDYNTILSVKIINKICVA